MLLTQTNNQSLNTKKTSKKCTLMIAITVLLLFLGLLLVLAVVSNWIDNCTITITEDNYNIKNGVMIITGLGSNTTLKICYCMKITSIIVTDNTLEKVSSVEISSILKL